MKLFRNISPENLTGYGCGGTVDKYIEVETRQELKELFRKLDKKGEKVSILGEGYNTLIGPEGLRGVLLKLTGEFSHIEVNLNEIKAGASLRISELIRTALLASLSGVEFLAGVPGTVGGAVKGNAGAGSEDISGIIREVEYFDGEGYKTTRNLKEYYSYRNFYSPEVYIITSSVFKLSKSTEEIIENRIKARLKSRKKNQPDGASCGSVFKNPPGQAAWRLIDEAGLRGHRIGGAWISEKHANFIMTEKGASSLDVWNLINKIKKSVLSKSGVELELEIKLIGKGFE